jgi:micrococcal nuclease
VGPQGQGSPQEHSRTVTRIIDGDTIELDGGERVRLIGVDTPEMNDARGVVHYYAREAFQFTTQILQRKVVRLEFDLDRKDKYGRTLAYVFLSDGTFVNAEIIRQGHGFAYTRFPFKYLEEFRALERNARERGVGLWAASAQASSTSPARARGVSRRAENVAPTIPTAPIDQRTCPASSPIKANLTTHSGDCIYHVPGGRFYARTKPERCFATEAAALAAKCRRSRR